MSVKYHGKRGIVYVSPDSSSDAIYVGAIRGFTLDMTKDYVDVTEFGSANKEYVAGFQNFIGTLDGFWASDISTVQSANNSVAGTHIYLYPSQDASSKYIGGPAFLDASIRSAVDQAVVQNANFRARGTWVNEL